MNFDRDSIANDNICVIWVDDMFDVFTWREAYGVRLQTPNIDNLLGQGVRFSNTYATVPLCSPCRAELATGLSPFRTGLVDLNRIWREALPPEKSWVFDLRRSGFYTFTTGKVDGKYKPMDEEYRRLLFHEEPAARDRYHGLDMHQFASKGRGISSVGYGQDVGQFDEYFYDGMVAQNTIDHIRRLDPKRRHYIQLGFKHPHTPYTCPDRFYQLYDVDQIKWPETAHPADFFGPQPGMARYEHSYIVNGKWTPEAIGEDNWRHVVRGYFAACSHVDYEIGRVLDALGKSRIAQNTTVIFLSDNGFNLGTHDSFHKMSQWDSAAHIPLGIWSPRMKYPQVVDLPVSLHNIPKTIMDLAGLPPRPDWPSGQSLLPLIDESFGTYDHRKSPVTSVFGTLSVRPSQDGLSQYRYFRYPNGEEHVYDLVKDPGETTNIVEQAPLNVLRDILVENALDLDLDLRAARDPSNGVRALASLDGSVILRGGDHDNHYWVYGSEAERIDEDEDGGSDTLWYLGGPDDYVLHAPMNIESIRIATVNAFEENAPGKHIKKTIQVVAHPATPMNFESSERVDVHVSGSTGADRMFGPRYGSATMHGGAGSDYLAGMNDGPVGQIEAFGGSGDDTLLGNTARDFLDGGAGNDHIVAKDGGATVHGGHGNDSIEMGQGPGFVDVGPGRNRVRLGKGDKTVVVGSGVTIISPDVGGIRFRIAWGGVTIIERWRPRQRYDLTSWPGKPKLIRTPDRKAIFELGLSKLVICRVNESHDISKQISL